MANNIQLGATFKIRDGKLESFKNIAAVSLAVVKAKDTGTTQYDWFFNEDESVCVSREAFEDSDALLQHMGRMGDLLQKLTENAEMSIEVFGEPSPALAEAGADLAPKIWNSFQGL